MRSGALGYWHLYFVISTEALRDQVRSGEIFDSDFYDKRMCMENNSPSKGTLYRHSQYYFDNSNL